MLFVLLVLCAVLARIFLIEEAKEEYVKAVILKGLASLCFVIIGFMCNPGNHVSNLIVAGLVIGCVADVMLNLRMVFKEKGQLIFLVSDIVLILNTFGSEFRQSLRNTNISLYYAGQLLIAFSLTLLA